jgi:hypothetical protein
MAEGSKSGVTYEIHIDKHVTAERGFTSLEKAKAAARGHSRTPGQGVVTVVERPSGSVVFTASADS